MLMPESNTEKLMYTTVRLEASDGSSGTGFFYNFEVDGNIVPVIITNQHVVNYDQLPTMSFYLHLYDDNGNPGSNYKVTVKTQWYFHSSKDLCFCYINPIFEQVKKNTGKAVFYIGIDNSLVATQEMLNSLSAQEEVSMVGYPIGLWDQRNNLPIFRRGFTSAHPAIDFNEENIGLVDMACFPGSSGSPIFINNEGSYTNKKGTVYISNRFIFLGVLFAGPTYAADGQVITQTIPTAIGKGISQTKVMANLGYYIKAAAIKDFERQVAVDLKKQMNA